MIRWIRPRLGTAPFNEIPEGDFAIVDVRRLVDKSGNPSTVVLEAVEAGLQLLRAGRTVVIACDFGISRSNSIAAGVLSRAEGKTFDAALVDVIDATGEAEIKIAMIEAVRAALESVSRRSDRSSLLITGGSGFIGRHVPPLMTSEQRVLTPLRNTLDLEKGAAELGRYCCEQNIGQILHLAYPRQYTNTNAAGSSINMLRAVLDVCRTLDIRLIFVSSWVVFSGYASTSLWADESVALRSKGAYGDSKYIEEMLVRAHADRGDVKVSIARFAPVYGPGGDRPRLIGTFHQSLLRGETISTHRFRNGRPALDLLHVTDAAQALCSLISSGIDDDFHFGSGTLTETAAIAQLIAEIVQKPLRLDEIEIDDETSNVAMISAKAARRLDWKASVDVETGFRRMLNITR